jgi:hypothetical protein
MADPVGIDLGISCLVSLTVCRLPKLCRVIGRSHLRLTGNFGLSANGNPPRSA